MYTQVHKSNIDNIWHLVVPWIAQAIGDSDTWADVQVIYNRAKAGDAIIWIGRDAYDQIDVVLVSENWFLEGRKILVLRWLCGKHMEEWLRDIELVEGWAITNGFQGIHIWGRPGWVKTMKSLGYSHEFTVVSKPLIRGLN